MRDLRPRMVQKPEQYSFLNEAILKWYEDNKHDLVIEDEVQLN